MSPKASGSTSHSPVYNKAQEILHLTRHIAHYLRQDLAPLKRNGEEHYEIYFTGDIIQQSVLLGPQILKAESQQFQDEKHKYASSVMSLSNLLYKNCRRLERINSNGKDFLPLLLAELKRFRKLQHVWRLTL